MFTGPTCVCISDKIHTHVLHCTTQFAWRASFIQHPGNIIINVRDFMPCLMFVKNVWFQPNQNHKHFISYGLYHVCNHKQNHIWCLFVVKTTKQMSKLIFNICWHSLPQNRSIFQLFRVTKTEQQTGQGNRFTCLSGWTPWCPPTCCMPNKKTPGPDVFLVWCYKEFWT